MLVHISELLSRSHRGQYAIPAFNTMNLEITRGIIAAAEQMHAPIILETSEGAIHYAGLETIYEIMVTLAKQASVPIALHMDHGKDIDQLKRGLELGYSSVMIDHSALTYDRNVSDTRAVVEFAHARGAWVQGEVGRIQGSEDWVSVTSDQSLLTTPDEARRYVMDTGIDTLAPAVGTVHGMIKLRGQVHPQIDFDRIQAIAEAVPCPLVLHGASGVSDEDLMRAIGAGIGVVNIDSDLRVAFSDALRQTLHDLPDETDPRHILQPSIAAVTQIAVHKLAVLQTAKYFA